jgi:hypothetical protein
LTFHAGDDPRFDAQFPEHPLSRAPAWARRIAAATVDLGFAALPPFTAGGPARRRSNSL